MQNSNYLDDRFIEEVKNSNNIVDIISRYVDLKKNGDNYKGLCPFHNEKTPSFVVSEKKQIFKCFGCGESGNVVSFLMKKENMPFHDAMKKLCENANIPYPTNGKLDEKTKLENEKKTKMYKLHTDLAKYYFSNMQKNMDSSIDYMRTRGIDEKTIKKFGLGYESRTSSSIEYLSSIGYTNQDMLESMLYREKNDRMYSIFFSRVIYPIFDYRNRVVAFGGRTTEKNGIPKYINSPENLIFKKKNELYGLNLSKKYNSKRIILVEGYMDVIRLYQNGIVGAVASLGTSLTKEQSEIIKKQNKKVYICYDSDSAGTLATIRAIEILMDSGITPYIISLDDCKDPDEFFNQKKSSDFMQKIETAISPLSFIIEDTKSKYNLAIHSQMLEFIDVACEKIAKYNDEVEKEYQVKKLSDMTNVSIKAIGVKVYGEYFSPKRFGLDNSNSWKKIEEITIERPKIEVTNLNEKRFNDIIAKNPQYIHYIIDILDESDILDYSVIQIYQNAKNYTKDTKNTDEQIVKKLALGIKYEHLQNEINKLDELIKNETDDVNIIKLNSEKIELIKKSRVILEKLK